MPRFDRLGAGFVAQSNPGDGDRRDELLRDEQHWLPLAESERRQGLYENACGSIHARWNWISRKSPAGWGRCECSSPWTRTWKLSCRAQGAGAIQESRRFVGGAGTGMCPEQGSFASRSRVRCRPVAVEHDGLSLAGSR